MELIDSRSGLDTFSRIVAGDFAGNDEPRKVACIGSRDLSPDALRFCEQIGYAIAKSGAGRLFVGSGNATGADQAYARGVNKVDPTLLVVYQPWESYEKQAVVAGNRVRTPPYDSSFEKAAEELHGAWEKLGRGPRAMHTRNMAILDQALLCVAWPGAKAWGGGTGTGVRRAVQLGIPVIDLRIEEVRVELAELIGAPVPRLASDRGQRRLGL